PLTERRSPIPSAIWRRSPLSNGISRQVASASASSAAPACAAARSRRPSRTMRTTSSCSESPTRTCSPRSHAWPSSAAASALTGAHVVTMDDAGSEYPDGWVLVAGGRVEATGGGTPPTADERVALAGAVVTPGLVNTHHHLYQTLTRARAQEADLFTWLKTLYPLWARLDAEAEHAAARTGLAELALSGCSTVFDHHYVFPRGSGDLIEAGLSASGE